MTPFEIVVPGRIIFGRGKAALAGDLILQFGTRVLVVHGANAQRADWLLNALEDAAVLTVSCTGEPDLAQVEDGLEVARDFQPDFVVAVGGGAALDLGKALAALIPASRPIIDHLEVVGKGLPLESAPLPFIAIPTTSGTGSEVTKNAVIGIPAHKRKVSLRDPRMLADLVIVDPALVDNCPRHVTLASGLDAITQLIEPYVCRNANAFTDSLCLNALPTALSAIRVLSEREDTAARDAMAWASLCSGIALANAGLGAVHGFAGVIGGITGAPHGEICASLLPCVLEGNRRAMIDGGLDTSRIDYVAGLIAREFDVSVRASFSTLGDWTRGIGIRTITDLGLSVDEFPDVAEGSKSSSSMRANPVDLNVTELTDILRQSCVHSSR